MDSSAAPVFPEPEAGTEKEPVAYKEAAIALYFVCDTTGSMAEGIEALRQTLPQILAVSRILFGGSPDIHIISYKDYCDSKVIEECHGSPQEMEDFAECLRPTGGGDGPEAIKTALNRVLELVAADPRPPTQRPQPVVFHFTDAGPHCPGKDAESCEGNIEKEQVFLANSPAGFDWLAICRAFRTAAIPVFTFLECPMYAPFYCLLGQAIQIPGPSSFVLTRTCVGVLLQLFGESLEESVAAPIMQFEMPTDEQPQSDDGLYVFVNSWCKKMDCKRFFYPALSGLPKLLGGLPKRFEQDPTFVDIVFEVLMGMFTPKCVLAITYNRILGTLWRACCRRRQDERLPCLLSALSQCVVDLPEQGTDGENPRASVQKWLDESYDRTEELEEAVRAAEEEAVKSGAGDKGERLVLEAAAAGEWVPTRDELMSLARSPLPSVLAAAQKMLTHVVVVKGGDGEEGKLSEDTRYLPLALRDEQLFSMLPHLVVRGTMFTRKPAAVVASLAWLSGNACLRERASRFLHAIRGAWIPLDKVDVFPEVMSAGFVRLMAMPGLAEFLTEKEQRIFTQANHIRRLRMAGPKTFTVKRPFQPKTDEVFPDEKQPCAKCHHTRSLSLIEDSLCGLCLGGLQDPPPDPADCSSTESHLLECRSCRAVYAISQPQLLAISPKCHYCRLGPTSSPAPTLTCSTCLNRFVRPTAPPPSDTPFTCETCRKLGSDRSIQASEVPLVDLVKANPHILSMFSLPELAVDVLFDPSGGSLFKLYSQHPEFFTSVAPPIPPAELPALHLRGKPCHFSGELAEAIHSEVLTGTLSGTCFLCFEEVALLGLESACGQCENSCCAKCLASWYGQVQPGRLVLLTHLTCAFCRRSPATKTLRKFNKLACAIVGGKGNASQPALRADMYHAWCMMCYKVKEVMQRECAAGELPNVTAFVCESCQDLPPAAATPCPGCAAPTHKHSGCNHITCPCGVHWCYECGSQFPEDEIYDHMHSEHGGIGV